MKLYTTTLNNFQEYPENFKEQFIFPDALVDGSVLEVMKTVRNKSFGNWKRVPRQITDVQPFTLDLVTDTLELHDKFKYISTINANQVEQIFIFSKFVDHDCMYEAILNFEDNVDSRFRTLVGAGFTDFKTCFGRSETLNLDSRETLDTNLLVF